MVSIGAMIFFSPRQVHSYWGTMPLKLNRSSIVKSVPEIASVRWAVEMRRTRRSVGTYTQVSSFFASERGPSDDL